MTLATTQQRDARIRAVIVDYSRNRIDRSRALAELRKVGVFETALLDAADKFTTREAIAP